MNLNPFKWLSKPPAPKPLPLARQEAIERRIVRKKGNTNLKQQAAYARTHRALMAVRNG